MASGQETLLGSALVEEESSWSRLRRLLQRCSELEAAVQRSVEEKCKLEKRNGELSARVEAWASTHTDAVVLAGGEFLELEANRRVLVESHEQAAAGQAAAEAEVAQAMELHGMLRGELDELWARLRASRAAKGESRRSVGELEVVAAKLKRQLAGVSEERGRLLEERRSLAQEEAAEAAAAARAAAALDTEVDVLEISLTASSQEEAAGMRAMVIEDIVAKGYAEEMLRDGQELHGTDANGDPVRSEEDLRHAAYPVVLRVLVRVSKAEPKPPEEHAEPEEKAVDVLTRAEIGARVVRGPDWEWSNDDGGPGGLGTVIFPEADPGFARVRWDAGGEDVYRVGAQERFDLKFAKNEEPKEAEPQVAEPETAKPELAEVLSPKAALAKVTAELELARGERRRKEEALKAAAALCEASRRKAERATEEAAASKARAKAREECGAAARAALEQEQASWAMEKTVFREELSRIKEEGERSKRAASASLGQLVLERQELQEKVAAAKARAAT